jgi:hypothetical protein
MTTFFSHRLNDDVGYEKHLMEMGIIDPSKMFHQLEIYYTMAS